MIIILTIALLFLSPSSPEPSVLLRRPGDRYSDTFPHFPTLLCDTSFPQRTDAIPTDTPSSKDSYYSMLLFVEILL